MENELSIAPHHPEFTSDYMGDRCRAAIKESGIVFINYSFKSANHQHVCDGITGKRCRGVTAKVNPFTVTLV